MRIRVPALIALALSVGTAMAQVQTRRATSTGSRGDRGKCTIEVDVDGSAEVEIRGSDARLRTMTGLPAIWRRFECSDPLPRNPADFRFSGIDGRGSQNLLRDPRQNGGVAVIRIDDPKGGREGYTFDIEWTGGSYGGNSGWNNDRNWNNDDRNRNNDDRGNNGNGRGWGWGRGNNQQRGNARDAVETCKNAVRAEAADRYGVESLNFTRAELDNNAGRRDFISGTFFANRGRRRGDFSFTCSVDLSSGQVRRANVVPIQR